MANMADLPTLLDLEGKMVKIAQISSSSIF